MPSAHWKDKYLEEARSILTTLPQAKTYGASKLLLVKISFTFTYRFWSWPSVLCGDKFCRHAGGHYFSFYLWDPFCLLLFQIHCPICPAHYWQSCCLLLLWYHLVWHWPATDLISTLNKDQHSHQCHTAAQMVTKLPVYVLCALLAINLVLMIRAADFKQWQKLHF